MTDLSYHLRRAEEEAERASRCDDPYVAQAHLELAELHRRKALKLGGLTASQIMKLGGASLSEN